MFTIQVTIDPEGLTAIKRKQMQRGVFIKKILVSNALRLASEALRNKADLMLTNGEDGFIDTHTNLTVTMNVDLDKDISS